MYFTEIAFVSHACIFKNYTKKLFKSDGDILYSYQGHGNLSQYL